MRKLERGVEKLSLEILNMEEKKRSIIDDFI
jgi:hypothetical protein